MWRGETAVSPSLLRTPPGREALGFVLALEFHNEVVDVLQ
jgi:hypothetical protein